MFEAVPQVLAEWKRQADPVGAEAEAERLFGQRALHLSPAWSGMVHLNGDLDPESGGVVLAAIRRLAEPAALDPDDPRTRPKTGRRAGRDLPPLPRRQPGTGSGRPQVSVTVPWDTLQQAPGLVDTEVGPIPAETARRLACDATMSRIIVDKDGVPVFPGRPDGYPPSPPPGTRPARRHCTHPGCDIPARWCDAHHIMHWADGGKTDLANLHLLCRPHHRTAHHHQPYPRRERAGPTPGAAACSAPISCGHLAPADRSAPPMTELDEHGRPEPPIAGDEIATLLGFLDYQRATLAWKCAGLDAAGLRVTVGASTITLGGLLKHLAYVEDYWFSQSLHGRAKQPPWDTVDWKADPDWEWHSAAEDSRSNCSRSGTRRRSAPGRF